MINNKRAQGMSTSTIILLILGLIILVVLVLGFTLGWNKILPFVKSDNIDTLKTSCDIACSTGSVYGYCSKMQTVNDGVNKKFDETCYNLADVAKYPAYGIESCPEIECPPPVSE